jgi:hypothetical protein
MASRLTLLFFLVISSVALSLIASGTAIKIDELFRSTIQGVGISNPDINKNRVLEPAIFSIDHHDGRNLECCRIFWSVNNNGDIGKWNNPAPLDGWFGDELSASGIGGLSKLDGEETVLCFTVTRSIASFRVGA